MRNARTTQVSRDEVDFMVLEFSCRDDSMLSGIGKHCKECRWRISVGSEAAPVEIKVNVDKQVIKSEEVSVEWNGTKVFPSAGASRSKLKEDFNWRAPFRGTVKGINKKNFFEMRPEHMSTENWFAATLIEQRDDGMFKVNAVMPDGRGGTKEVFYPAVRTANIREADGMKMPLSTPQRNLVLEVPKSDPMNCLLQVDDEKITHFFGRPTPPPKVQRGGAQKSNSKKSTAEVDRPTILFKVDKDRTQVSGDCGHSTLAHFLAGAVKNVGQEGNKLKQTWTVQIGPFAQHVIEVEKKYKSSKVASLSVDGELLVEGTGDDIDSRPEWWEASFRLAGERSIDWEVYEHDVNGRALNTQGIVQQITKVNHTCVVSFLADEKDLTKARFTIDDVEFDCLQQWKVLDNEEKLVIAPEAMQGSYDLTVPFKVSDAPLSGFAALTGNIQNAISPTNASGGGGGFFAFLGKCCCSQNIPDDSLPSASMAT